MDKNQDLLKAIDAWSKTLLRIVIIGIITILLIQSLLQIGMIRKWIIPTERWEGKQLTFTNDE